MPDDWYRRTKWTKKDQEEFFARLHRSRCNENKAQYLRIQATYLEEKYPAEASLLLSTIINDYPEQTQLAQSYLQMAHCQIRLHKTKNAIEYFRKTLTHEQNFPHSLTRAYLEYPVYVVSTANTELYPEVLDILEKTEVRLTYPIDEYQHHSVSAIINDYYGDKEQATRHAKIALAAADKKYSGFRYHPKVGLVNKKTRIFGKQLKKIVK